MNRICRWTSIGLALCVMLCALSDSACALTSDVEGFTLVEAREIADLDGTVYRYRHVSTGAEVIYLDNGAEQREFTIGFATPPTDNRGANHVLEHCLVAGSEKYPTKNIMNYIQSTALTPYINAVTMDDYTYYYIKTDNETEYYNLMDVYMNGIFHPLLLRDENIFRREGIRLEYADGRARYNGIVYNELSIKSYDTDQSAIQALNDALYEALYGDTAPAFSSGGSIEGLKQLTYADLMRVYSAHYNPSDSMTFLAGAQDLTKTLNALNSFFGEFERRAADISYVDTKQLPEEPISAYGVTEQTQYVDIGFMSSGVPMWESDMDELFARNILFEIVRERMKARFGDNYSTVGCAGGIANLGMLIPDVPIAQQEAVIDAYREILADMEANGVEDALLDEKLEAYMARRRNADVCAVEQSVFEGLLYHDDPFFDLNRSAVEEELRSHKERFDAVLKRYFTENPCAKIIVMGHGAAGTEEQPDLSEAELERLREDTMAFQAWSDEPDDPAVIEALPLLTLDEVRATPERATPRRESVEGIAFYHTQTDRTHEVSLYFPLNVALEDLSRAQLLCCFLKEQTRKAGISDVYFTLNAMESWRDAETIRPQIVLGLTGEHPERAIADVLAMLREESTWDADALAGYIENAPETIRMNGYDDPLWLSKELESASLAAGDRFNALTTGCVQQGSVPYYHFLLAAEAPESLLRSLREMSDRLILGTKPTVEYVGSSGCEAFRDAVAEQFADANENRNAQMQLPVGPESAATITSRKGFSHMMLAGRYEKGEYSGKLSVLGSVLTAKYILPEMREKYGAYGANVTFYDDGMSASVAGLTDVDVALSVWQGMGDFLRGLNMTQRELDAMIVSVVKEYDEYDYRQSEHGASAALRDMTEADLNQRRDEMLATTVEDLRACADLVDQLVAQNRLFAVLSRENAASTKFPFACCGDAETLEVTLPEA